MYNEEVFVFTSQQLLIYITYVCWPVFTRTIGPKIHQSLYKLYDPCRLSHSISLHCRPDLCILIQALSYRRELSIRYVEVWPIALSSATLFHPE
jgi:hypothetical protein